MELPDEFMDDLDLRPHGYQLESMLDGYGLSNFHLLYYVTNIYSGLLSVAKVTDIYGVPNEVIHTVYNESNLLSYLYNCWNYNKRKQYNKFLNLDNIDKWVSGNSTVISDASTCTTPSNGQELIETQSIDFYINNTSTTRVDSNDFTTNDLTFRQHENDTDNIFPIVKLETTITLNSHIIMIIENCEGGSLYSIIKRYMDYNNKLPLGHIKSIIMQLLNALDFIHSKNVYHGDINPSNILFADKQQTILKLSDFETSQWYNNDDELQNGSILVNSISNIYKPPEQLIGTYTPTAAADLWAAGCILYELITLTHYFTDNIFNGDPNNDTNNINVYYEYKSQQFKSIPTNYLSFIPLLDILLDYYPIKRLEGYNFFK